MSKNENKDNNLGKINQIIASFTQEDADELRQEILNLMEENSLSIRGEIWVDPALQFSFSKDGTELKAILRDANDKELKKTFLEVNLLDGKFHFDKNSNLRKKLADIKKQIKKFK